VNEMSNNSIFLGNRREYFEYELLTLQDGYYSHSSYITDYIISCTITLDFSRDIITSCSINMRNNDTINYLEDLIRPWYCMIVDGITYKYPLGTFLLSSPDKMSDGKIVTRSIAGYDLLLALDQDKTTASSSYDAGTSVIDTVESILTSVGTWVNYYVEASSETLAENMSYEIGRSKLFIINSLLNTINYTPLWADGNGVIRSIPWSDIVNKTWEFEDNTESLYESGINLKLDYSQMYNKVVVIAAQLTADTEPLYKIWTFEDEGLTDHPLSYTSIGRYITKIFNSEASSQEYVDLRARKEIRKMLEIEESINYKHAFITNRSNDGLPYNGDGFLFKNTLLNANATYKIESLSYNLKVGELVNTTIRRVTGV